MPQFLRQVCSRRFPLREITVNGSDISVTTISSNFSILSPMVIISFLLKKVKFFIDLVSEKLKIEIFDIEKNEKERMIRVR